MKSSLTTKVVEVTPALADEWLALNTTNRNMRRSVVALLTQEILAGNWRLTGEAIKFDNQGRLIDGQHRLAAITRAKMTVPCLVIWGLATDVQSVLDAGARRTPADALALHGLTNVNILAASGRLAYLYEEGLLYEPSAQTQSNTTILNYVLANQKELEPAAAWGHRVARTVDIHPSAAAAAYFLTAKVDREAADEFFGTLATGVGLTPGSPILALTSRTRELARKKVRVFNVDHLSLLLRAWNLWRRGETTTSLYFYSGKGNSPTATVRAPKSIL